MANSDLDKITNRSDHSQSIEDFEGWVDDYGRPMPLNLRESKLRKLFRKRKEGDPSKRDMLWQLLRGDRNKVEILPTPTEFLLKRKNIHRMILVLSALGIALPTYEILVDNSSIPADFPRAMNNAVIGSAPHYTDQGEYVGSFELGASATALSWTPLIALSALFMLIEILTESNPEKKVKQLILALKKITLDEKDIERLDQIENFLLADVRVLPGVDKTNAIQMVNNLIDDARSETIDFRQIKLYINAINKNFVGFDEAKRQVIIDGIISVLRLERLTDEDGEHLYFLENLLLNNFEGQTVESVNKYKLEIIQILKKTLSKINDVRNLNSIISKLDKSFKIGSGRLLLSVFVLSITLGLYSDNFTGGIKPFEELRTLFPLAVSNDIGAADMSKSLEAIANYLFYGQMNPLQYGQQLNDFVFTPDQYDEKELNYEGTIGQVTGDAYPLGGYYAYYITSTPQLESRYQTYQNLSSYTAENYIYFARNLDSITPFLTMNNLELNISSIYENQMQNKFAYLLSRISGPSDWFSNPFYITDVVINETDNKENTRTLVEGQDYELLSDPLGFTIVKFKGYPSSTSKFNATYKMFNINAGVTPDVEFDKTGYWDSLDFALLDTYPDGVINITDSDAEAAGFKFDDINTDVITELLDESVYDINIDPEFINKFPEFLNLLNSDELVELYCTNTAQAAQMLNHILSSPKFKVFINGQHIKVKSMPLYIAVGSLIDPDGYVDNVDGHAFNVVQDNDDNNSTGDLLIRDWTPGKLSPDISELTKEYLVAKEKTNRSSSGANIEIHITGADNPNDNQPVPVGVAAALILTTILGKVVHNQIRETKKTFKERFGRNRDLVVLKVLTRTINEVIYGNPKKEVKISQKLEIVDSIKFKDYTTRVTNIQDTTAVENTSQNPQGGFVVEDIEDLSIKDSDRLTIPDDNVNLENLFEYLILNNKNNKKKFLIALDRIRDGLPGKTRIEIFDKRSGERYVYTKKEIEMYLRFLRKEIQSNFFMKLASQLEVDRIYRR